MNLTDQLTRIIYRQKQFLNQLVMITTYNNPRKYDHRGHSASFGNPRKKIKHYSYHPTDRIGKGFSSIVYKGTNDNTNEIVAIKAIDMKGVKDSISREMLDCQIEALSTIKNDCVLKCFQVVREQTHCYIITEFCNQGDLSALLKKKKKMNEAQTMRILRDIVYGFVEIGTSGFLHRDLKLANIFMHDNIAKIADFGFAKKNRFNSQKQKYNVGSPLYMSPQALKKNIYSLKNDIWSIGVMAYELLHGETPWECKTEKQLIDKMTRIPVRFRESLKISQPLKNFIKQCLEVDEAKRMSLDGLKLWLQNDKLPSSTPGQILPLGTRQENLPPKLNLSHKPISNIDKISYPDSSKDRSTRTHRHQISDKENINGRPSGLGISIIPKSIVQKNNAILVNQINTFRLMFKLYEKIMKRWPEEGEITKILGKQVIRRVTTLKECCDKFLGQYGLSMPERYFDERQNTSIRKYKSVVSEYFKKYSHEIHCDPYPSSYSINDQLKHFLNKKSGDFNNQQELVIGYWGVQLLEVSRETSKEKLDGIIEPKLRLNAGYIEQRIKQANQ